MKYRILFFMLFVVALGSCSDKYEQYYENFIDYNQANIRNKSWSPKFISDGCYNIKSTSYLDSLCAFGTFSYSNKSFYDSVFDNSNKVSFYQFEQKVRAHLKRKPSWFLNVDNISKDDYQIVQENRMLIARQPKNKTIFFILSD